MSAPCTAAQGPRHKGSSRQLHATAPTRKVFNCIIDESAFLAGIKKSTRDGLRKWIENGSVRLFVPLQTLGHLKDLSATGGRSATDACEALAWLDTVTSDQAVPNAHLVELEGGEEFYDSWDSVEAFLLPETLLSMIDSTGESDRAAAAAELDNSQTTSPGSNGDSESLRSAYSATNPVLLNGGPRMDDKLPLQGANTEPNGRLAVPVHLQQFFNHVIWRIHHEQNPRVKPESFILLTNDPAKRTMAQRFSIRAKRLEQMRDIIGREERDFRNRQARMVKETQTNGATAPEQDASDEDEDEVLYKPQAVQKQVLDPGDFTRGQHGARRGGRYRQRCQRGCRGGKPPAKPRVAEPRSFDTSGPIDPNSYARPPPVTNAQRGGRPKLWEPK